MFRLPVEAQAHLDDVAIVVKARAGASGVSICSQLLRVSNTVCPGPVTLADTTGGAGGDGGAEAASTHGAVKDTLSASRIGSALVHRMGIDVG
ncbi:hypothetical protein ABIB73_004514 [Bradyrhizobium sp. F1.4.3]|uniref:hypothetical protein n=1 Tax=Bradyrhizobium sp. F1.4.3 TaxID=3156356 RepID=UPI003395B35D